MVGIALRDEGRVRKLPVLRVLDVEIKRRGRRIKLKIATASGRARRASDASACGRQGAGRRDVGRRGAAAHDVKSTLSPLMSGRTTVVTAPDSASSYVILSSSTMLAPRQLMGRGTSTRSLMFADSAKKPRLSMSNE